MLNFNEAPFLVVWEVTQACDLVCAHSRGLAQVKRDSQELTTSEGYALIDQVRECGDPLLMFTGGDPLKQPDLFRLLRYAAKHQLRTAITAAATPLLTSAAVEHFYDCGATSMTIGLDGPDLRTHDGLRGVAGSFQRTLQALQCAREIGLVTNIDTALTRRNWKLLGQLAELIARCGAKLWTLSFPLELNGFAPAEYEQVFEFLYQLSKLSPFEIRTAEAQHYRRYVAQRRKAERAAHETAAQGPLQTTAGMSDGKGTLFITHTGDIHPSSCLPLPAGNVRSDNLLAIYRSAPLFRALRRPQDFQGKCGYCEYRNLCGGSRSRVYALQGDPYGSDPRCTYQPQRIPASQQLIHLM